MSTFPAILKAANFGSYFFTTLLIAFFLHYFYFLHTSYLSPSLFCPNLIARIIPIRTSTIPMITRIIPIRTSTIPMITRIIPIITLIITMRTQTIPMRTHTHNDYSSYYTTVYSLPAYIYSVFQESPPRKFTQCNDLLFCLQNSNPDILILYILIPLYCGISLLRAGLNIFYS